MFVYSFFRFHFSSISSISSISFFLLLSSFFLSSFFLNSLYLSFCLTLFFLTPYIQMVVISAQQTVQNDTTKQRHVDRLLSLITLPWSNRSSLWLGEGAWSFPQSLSHSEHPERLFPHFHGGIESQRPPHTPSSATAVTLQALFSSLPWNRLKQIWFSSSPRPIPEERKQILL